MYRFLVCEFVSGIVLDELHMEITSELTRGLQMYGEGTLSLPLFNERGEPVSSTWLQNIQPWRTLIVVTDDQYSIVWAGSPYARRRQGNEARTEYPCRSPEAYFISRYTPALYFEGKDQAEIFRSLVSSATGAGFEIMAPATGVVRNQAYADDENARIYDRMNELAAIEGGFDWTVDVVWADDDHTRVRKIVRLGYPHLGNRDLNPEHVFETGQNITEWSYDESWAAGDAATHVRAIGDGEGESKIISDPIIDTAREAAGWPRIEERRSFSGVTDYLTINSHAKRTAAAVFGGQKVLSVSVRNPGLGEDFTRLSDLTLGDTARIQIDTPQLVLDEVWPVVGWALTPETGEYNVTLAQLGDDNG